MNEEEYRKLKAELAINLEKCQKDKERNVNEAFSYLKLFYPKKEQEFFENALERGLVSRSEGYKEGFRNGVIIGACFCALAFVVIAAFLVNGMFL